MPFSKVVCITLLLLAVVQHCICNNIDVLFNRTTDAGNNLTTQFALTQTTTDSLIVSFSKDTSFHLGYELDKENTGSYTQDNLVLLYKLSLEIEDYINLEPERPNPQLTLTYYYPNGLMRVDSNSFVFKQEDDNGKYVDIPTFKRDYIDSVSFTLQLNGSESTELVFGVFGNQRTQFVNLGEIVNVNGPDGIKWTVSDNLSVATLIDKVNLTLPLQFKLLKQDNPPAVPNGYVALNYLTFSQLSSLETFTYWQSFTWYVRVEKDSNYVDYKGNPIKVYKQDLRLAIYNSATQSYSVISPNMISGNTISFGNKLRIASDTNDQSNIAIITRQWVEPNEPVETIQTGVVIKNLVPAKVMKIYEVDIPANKSISLVLSGFTRQDTTTVTAYLRSDEAPTETTFDSKTSAVLLSSGFSSSTTVVNLRGKVFIGVTPGEDAEVSMVVNTIDYTNDWPEWLTPVIAGVSGFVGLAILVFVIVVITCVCCCIRKKGGGERSGLLVNNRGYSEV
ncbi:hypothetical protein ABK040_006444 [Willaertia magna]